MSGNSGSDEQCAARPQASSGLLISNNSKDENLVKVPLTFPKNHYSFKTCRPSSFKSKGKLSCIDKFNLPEKPVHFSIGLQCDPSKTQLSEGELLSGTAKIGDTDGVIEVPKLEYATILKEPITNISFDHSSDVAEQCQAQTLIPEADYIDSYDFQKTGQKTNDIGLSEQNEQTNNCFRVSQILMKEVAKHDGHPEQSISSLKTTCRRKSERPKRPCCFCKKMVSKLPRHLSLIHSNEKEVRELSTLPTKERLFALTRLRHEGIFQHNKASPNDILVNKRSKTSGKSVMCLRCKGMYSSKYFNSHRCGEGKSFGLRSSLISKMDDGQDFKVEVLNRFQDGDIGTVCRTNLVIMKLGHDQAPSTSMTASPTVYESSAVLPVVASSAFCATKDNEAQCSVSSGTGSAKQCAAPPQASSEMLTSDNSNEHFIVKELEMLPKIHGTFKTYRPSSFKYSKKLSCTNNLNLPGKPVHSSISQKSDSSKTQQSKEELVNGTTKISETIVVIDLPQVHGLKLGSATILSDPITNRSFDHPSCNVIKQCLAQTLFPQADDLDPYDFKNNSQKKNGTKVNEQSTNDISVSRIQTKDTVKRNVQAEPSISPLKPNCRPEMARPKRPCCFCKKMVFKLGRHFLLIHSNEKEVKEMQTLTPKERFFALTRLRNEGIFQHNKASPNDILVNKRSKTSGKSVMCLRCKGMYSSKYFFAHNCGDEEDKARGIKSSIVSLTDADEDFKIEILNRFHENGIGALCRTEPVIIKLGHKYFRSYASNKSIIFAKRKTMFYMRELARVFVEFQKLAEEAGKKLNFSDIFQMEHIHHLIEAIHNLFKKSVNPRYGILLSFRSTIKAAAQELKVSYLISHEESKAEQVDFFLDALLERWNTIFGSSQNFVERRRVQFRQKSA